MSRRAIFQTAGIFCIGLLVAGCVNLKKVNDYAATSGKSIRKFEELGYSFVKSCNDKCVLARLDQNKFEKESCDCNASKEADSVTLLLYQAIKGYFDGLARLSNNETTSYTLDALSKALKEGNFGTVKINKENVDAYAKISGILTRAVTNGYRKRKLATYIGEANEAIKNLLAALEFNLVANLSKTLETKRSALKGFYFDLYSDAKTTAYEKVKIIEDFTAANAEIDLKKRQLTTFGKGLQTIAQGHQTLYENRNHFDTKELKEALAQYASDIQDMVDEINKLKNQD